MSFSTWIFVEDVFVLEGEVMDDLVVFFFSHVKLISKHAKPQEQQPPNLRKKHWKQFIRRQVNDRPVGKDKGTKLRKQLLQAIVFVFVW